MNKLTNKLLASICLLFSGYMGAQTTTFYVEGLGRTLITSDALDGEITQSDTVGGFERLDTRGVGGYTLLDLGFNLEKKDKFFLNTILRGRDEFGLFFGEGTTFEFRKITLGGIIGRGIRYEVGDIYVEMTPYTVNRPEVDNTQFESALFSTRREIVEYENFIKGNSHFLQGVKSNGTLLFVSGIKKLHFGGFATRSSEITQLGDPDILLAGANVLVDQGDFGKIGLNIVSLLDLPVSTAAVTLDATTFTATVNPKYDITDELSVGIDAELGGSNYSSSNSAIQDEAVEFSGGFYDAAAKVESKTYKAVFNVGFKSVQPNFRSPASQTRTINAVATPQLFTNNQVDPSGNLIQRDLLYFDRFTQENIYNNGISNRLTFFDPRFDNVTPYGEGTPNRQGLTLGFVRGTAKDAWSVNIKAKLLTEVIADDGAGEERDFTAIDAGGIFNLSKVLDWEKDVYASFNYQLEQTTRGGSSEIDLNSSVIDAGITVELIDNLDFLAGAKIFTAEGNEFIAPIDEFNNLRNFLREEEYDVTETILSLGGRFRFTDRSALNVFYNFNAVSNDFTENVEDDFDINQLFVNYTIQF